MGNERFLVLSYFLTGFLCLCVGLAAHFWLRWLADSIFASLRRCGLGRALRRLVLVSFVAMVLWGFVSVSYYGGCSEWSYEDIVGSGERMVDVNREQMANALD